MSPQPAAGHIIRMSRRGTDMKLLRAMRESLKYVQGKGALLKFEEEMGYMGKR